MNYEQMDPTQAAKLTNHLEQAAQNDFEPVVNVNIEKQINTTMVSGSAIKSSSLKDRIKALEEEYKGESKPFSLNKGKNNYFDEMGNDTFFVKNISNSHIAITDLDITIPLGKVEDLLTYVSLEDCYKSKDVRRCFVGGNGKSPFLKRLTMEEYADEMEKAIQTRKKIDVERQQETIKQSQSYNQMQGNNQFQNNPVAPEQAPKIRPMVLSKLEKLRLSKDPDPENSKYGMSPSDFIEWVMKESISENELNYILGDPVVSRMHNIKAAVVDKMTLM